MAQTVTGSRTTEAPSRRTELKKQPSRIDLERERNLIEQQMSRLEKARSKRKLILQREQIKSLNRTSQRDSFISTAPTHIMGSDVDSSGDSSVSCAAAHHHKCNTCCRKDRIISRQLHEIESLRQQLLEIQTQKVPVHLVCDDASMISGVTLRCDLQQHIEQQQQLEDSFRKL